ncbi:chemotaxis protein CheW [Bacillus shivajii]|uniref:chemotaxis protein CheW n=1 Tax=Bacillus shivajii TaxID=1983719 RepID=UPI001CFC0715|nr:chemotaxis protein CheW [Bacillus shivajii]UCZ53537.1 chemotaxis protein CheW [Bacillus shivajii]
MSEQFNKAVVCRVGDEEFGFPIEQVIAIEKPQTITPVPKTPEHILGITKIRGAVTPILDLRTYLLNQHSEADERNRIILVQIEDTNVGLLVDHAYDVLDIPQDKVESVNIAENEFTKSMNVVKMEDRLILLPDIQYMLTEMDAHLFQKLKEVV